MFRGFWRSKIDRIFHNSVLSHIQNTLLFLNLEREADFRQFISIQTIFGFSLFLVGAFYQNEPDYYSGKFFFRQTTECMRSGHFLQNYSGVCL